MYKQHHIGNQHGMATLAITVILLFVMTLVTLYAAKTSIKEQQISANQYRAEQSLSTANAALDWGGAYYADARGLFCKTGTSREACLEKNGICILDEASAQCEFIYHKNDQLSVDQYLSIGSSEMYYAFVDGGVEYPYIKVKDVADIHNTPIKIYGVGHSDDDTGKRIVSVAARGFNIFGDDGPGAINFPLITKGLKGVNSGGFTIINRFDNRTVWSGSNQAFSGSTHTYVAQPRLHCQDIDYDVLPDPIRTICINPAPDLEWDMEASEGKDRVNSDIIDGDTNLANLASGDDGEDFFLGFFGDRKGIIKGIAGEMNHVFEPDVDWDELVDEMVDEPKLAWINGDYSPSGGMPQLGTDADPMVLVIDGDFTATGAGSYPVQLVGIIYVTGEWDPGGNVVIRGVLITEGGVNGAGQGGTTLIYDPGLFGGKLGRVPGAVAGITPGAWKDWGNGE